MDWRQNPLPRNVETDSAAEPRVPSLAPHKVGLENSLDGCSDSRFDSGICESFNSRTSSYYSQSGDMSEILRQAESNIERLSLADRSPTNIQRNPPQTTFNLPSNDDEKIDSVISSIDPGYYSGNLFSALSGLGSLTSTDSSKLDKLPDQCSDKQPSIESEQFIQDLHDQKQREFASIFSQDEDGDT